ncbi:peptidylprolyl isomerase [Massilia sp. W12]|uniref:peptidylprolyl isomerase n=1 Tax=Massilia sp. W12 TaxID=3126507 RepID=UPI0030CC6AAE
MKLSSRFLCGVLLCQLSLAPSLATAASVTAPAVAQAARIDGAHISRLTLDAMSVVAQGEDSSLTREQILQTIIDNRLLARSIKTRFAAYPMRIGSQRVAFAPDVQIDDLLNGHLRSAYGKQIEARIKQLPGGTLTGLVTEQGKLDGATLDAVFGTSQSLLLDYNLAPAQLEKAKGVLLMKSALEGLTQISLYDVYVRQNVQGRVEFFNRNTEYMRQQAQQYLAGAYVQEWARQQFGAAAVEDLRQALLEQQQVRALEALHGLGGDEHADGGSKLLAHLAQAVSAAEIREYYQRHKEEFRRIDSLRARHIRIADESQARAIGAELSALQGAALRQRFIALARRHSMVDAEKGGDLGWIKHAGRMSWLQELAMLQEVGKVSAPFRAPVGAHEAAWWEIILVEERKDGYQAAASESVRYQAARAIARRKAAQQYAQLRAELRSKAKIELNPALLAQAGNGSAKP